MREWIKDHFSVGLSYTVAFPSWIGNLILFGRRRASEPKTVKEFLLGAMVGTVVLGCVVMTMLHSVP